MIIELIGSLVIQTSNIKETNVINLSPNRPVRSFVVGDSQHQISERARVAREESERLARQREVLARERSTVPGGSYTGTGSNIEIVGQSWEQCVIYYKRQTGKSESLGYAGNIAPKTQEAKVGYGALERNHISLVIAVYSDAVRVRESNWKKGYITERTIPKNQIRGYYF